MWFFQDIFGASEPAQKKNSSEKKDAQKQSRSPPRTQSRSPPKSKAKSRSRSPSRARVVVGSKSPTRRPSNKQHAKRMIVFDMDETLLHTFDTRKTMDFYDMQKLVKSKDVSRMFSDQPFLFSEEHWVAIKRPGCDDILRYSIDNFDVVVIWSAGSDDYVIAMCKELLKIFTVHDRIKVKIFPQSKCYNVKMPEYENGMARTKPLLKLIPFFPDITMENIIFVDDNEDNGMHNEENFLMIPKFKPRCSVGSIRRSNRDRCLITLLEFLEKKDVKKSKNLVSVINNSIFDESSVDFGDDEEDEYASSDEESDTRSVSGDVDYLDK